MSRARGERPPQPSNVGSVKDTGRYQPTPMRERPKQFNGKGKAPGLGDYAQFQEPYQAYWDVMRHSKVIEPQMPVIRPPVEIPDEKIRDTEYFVQKLKQGMSCSTFFVKNPNWVEPPIESQGIIISTPAVGVLILAGAGFRPLVTHTVPDRFVAIFCQIGNALEAPGAFGNVEFRIRIEGRFINISEPGTVQGIFTSQLGDPASPTHLCMPFIVQGKSTITVEAQDTDGNNHQGFFRLDGYQYPVKNITNDGSWGDYHQY